MTPARRVLNQAWAAWLQRVKDPPKIEKGDDADRCRALILQYINDGLGSSIKTYAGDNAFSWCGAFAAWCWIAGGLDTAKAKAMAVAADVKGQHPFGSTYKLHAALKADPTFAVAVDDIQPGDVCVVQHPGGKPYGDHIVLAAAWNKDKTELIILHGNGKGRGPDGAWMEGVVLSTVPKSVIVAAYRPNQRWMR